jgi:hypothetical protein
MSACWLLATVCRATLYCHLFNHEYIVSNGIDQVAFDLVFMEGWYRSCSLIVCCVCLSNSTALTLDSFT